MVDLLVGLLVGIPDCVELCLALYFDESLCEDDQNDINGKAEKRDDKARDAQLHYLVLVFVIDGKIVPPEGSASN